MSSLLLDGLAWTYYVKHISHRWTGLQPCYSKYINDFLSLRWLSKFDDRQRERFCLFVCFIDESERKNPAIHTTALLNQKNRPPAFWMTSESEFPSQCDSNEASLLWLLQHQGTVEPWDWIKDSFCFLCHTVNHLVHLEVEGGILHLTCNLALANVISEETFSYEFDLHGLLKTHIKCFHSYPITHYSA